MAAWPSSRTAFHVGTLGLVYEPISATSPSGSMRTGIGAGGTADVFVDGKIFFLEVDGSDASQVERDAHRMAEELLANTVIEGYDVRVLG